MVCVIITDVSAAEKAINYFKKLPQKRLKELKTVPEYRKFGSNGATFLADMLGATLIDENSWKRYREKLKELSYLITIKEEPNGDIIPQGGILLKRVCNNFGSPFISIYGKNQSYLCPQEARALEFYKIRKIIEEQKDTLPRIPSIVFKPWVGLRDHPLEYQTWLFEIDNEYTIVNYTEGPCRFHFWDRSCDIIMDVEKMGIEKAIKILDYFKQRMVERLKNRLIK